MEKMLFALFVILFVSCQNPQDDVSEDLQASDSTKTIATKENTTSDFLSQYPLTTWLGKSPAEIGCMLETILSHRDPVFNCDNKGYVNKGDPCKNTRAYYEGVEFPQQLVHNIHPVVEDVHLAFEHGNLREVTIAFKDNIQVKSIRKIFSLPTDEKNLPENIIQMSYGINGSFEYKVSGQTAAQALSLTGFEHQGEGEVDCE